VQRARRGSNPNVIHSFKPGHIGINIKLRGVREIIVAVERKKYYEF
jgi:hypothetical protein